mmetsp:Transcript_4976/g.10013  ORF Transcript_4976/g.10013 Transcript_4976/m.10013 type:complete len:150 (-) Transcript_4976:87-536(-)
MQPVLEDPLLQETHNQPVPEGYCATDHQDDGSKHESLHFTAVVEMNCSQVTVPDIANDMGGEDDTTQDDKVPALQEGAVLGDRSCASSEGPLSISTNIMVPKTVVMDGSPTQSAMPLFQEVESKFEEGYKSDGFPVPYQNNEEVEGPRL